ncbi:Putative flippase GtrA (transmembrane translocase of bactoprenol-linked glucose) [Paenibacillus catalpae]|uniref:Putative flippase GtrA (Transmembrane translocase of bactoprenol-linked glucose) n=1 Tax=Paenibacillus catalpae TaxID=1045775 RepID=A0A1I2GLC1_9BACL|nr:bifunctional glycosyltransferase family 2/GtrA family protein [Paenibacillus catalpae]SFF18734.1 Putative flippase GtrA (transmembrane translocase of bactoprenol-linked glucose) [Paenibacillus catalpae]
MTILIPSYEPDERLLTLIHHLKEETGVASILIVDDGSGEQYKAIFESAAEAGCTVLRHTVNKGKGSALKTGFDYVRQHGGHDGVVCADSDGQHLPEDILKITDAVRKNRNHIVLGSRQFTGKVPLRSRFGNSATRMVYSLATGKPIRDTQTGLRGYSSDMLDWLCEVPGDRFEYEMNMLLEAPKAGYDFVEVPIETVYLEDNKSSHFRPLTDSARIYFPFLKFCTSSGFAAVLDFVLLFLFQWLTSSLLIAVIGARVISSIFNFTMNRRFVFNDGQAISIKKSLPRYFSLVVVIMISNYALLYLFHESIKIPLFAAKLMTEALLFAFSYLVQRRFVY